jgi:hypothetical protein
VSVLYSVHGLEYKMERNAATQTPDHTHAFKQQLIHRLHTLLFAIPPLLALSTAPYTAI